MFKLWLPHWMGSKDDRHRDVAAIAPSEKPLKTPRHIDLNTELFSFYDNNYSRTTISLRKAFRETSLKYVGRDVSYSIAICGSGATYYLYVDDVSEIPKDGPNSTVVVTNTLKVTGDLPANELIQMIDLRKKVFYTEMTVPTYLIRTNCKFVVTDVVFNSPNIRDATMRDDMSSVDVSFIVTFHL